METITINLRLKFDSDLDSSALLELEDRLHALLSTEVRDGGSLIPEGHSVYDYEIQFCEEE